MNDRPVPKKPKVRGRRVWLNGGLIVVSILGIATLMQVWRRARREDVAVGPDEELLLFSWG